jgi:hypothetical protein
MKKNLFFMLLVLSCGVANALETVSDEEMSNISAQQGIALDLEFRMNTDASSMPLASLGGCAGTTAANKCKMAIHLNNRNSGGGEWLVLKDMYGSFLISNLYIDATSLPAAASPYANDSRFLDQAGTVCLPDGLGASGCAARLQGKPTLSMQYPGLYTVFESDVQVHLNIGRAAIEYGATGYNNDLRGSFMGLLVSDTTQKRAKIDIDGKIQMYGF